MDDQSLERWRDAVRRTKKALADSDPEAVHSLLKQLSGVQSALGKLADGTVSRTTLAEAVSEALRRLLREDRAGLLPDSLRDPRYVNVQVLGDSQRKRATAS